MIGTSIPTRSHSRVRSPEPPPAPSQSSPEHTHTPRPRVHLQASQAWDELTPPHVADADPSSGAPTPTARCTGTRSVDDDGVRAVADRLARRPLHQHGAY